MIRYTDSVHDCTLSQQASSGAAVQASVVEPSVDIVGDAGAGKTLRRQHKACEDEAQRGTNHVVRGRIAHHPRRSVDQLIATDGRVHPLQEGLGTEKLLAFFVRVLRGHVRKLLFQKKQLPLHLIALVRAERLELGRLEDGKDADLGNGGNDEQQQSDCGNVMPHLCPSNQIEKQHATNRVTEQNGGVRLNAQVIRLARGMAQGGMNP